MRHYLKPEFGKGYANIFKQLICTDYSTYKT